MIYKEELNRLHDACKMIEYDADEAYRTCVERFGRDIANVLIIAFYRKAFGANQEYPEPEGLREKINSILAEKGLLRE